MEGRQHAGKKMQGRWEVSLEVDRGVPGRGSSQGGLAPGIPGDSLSDLSGRDCGKRHKLIQEPGLGDLFIFRCFFGRGGADRSGPRNDSSSYYRGTGDLRGTRACELVWDGCSPVWRFFLHGSGADFSHLKSAHARDGEYDSS